MEILEHDPVTGITLYHDYDAVTDTTTLVTRQDCEPILENNKILQNLQDRGYTAGREWRRVAEIPLALLEKWRVEEGIDIFNENHWPAIVRKLNDTDYRFLRTAPGHLSGKLG